MSAGVPHDTLPASEAPTTVQRQVQFLRDLAFEADQQGRVPVAVLLRQAAKSLASVNAGVPHDTLTGDIREAVRSLVVLAQSVSLTGCNQEERDVLAHRSWQAIQQADALAAELARVSRELEMAYRTGAEKLIEARRERETMRDALADNERDARWIVAQFQRLNDEPTKEVALAIVDRSTAALAGSRAATPLGVTAHWPESSPERRRRSRAATPEACPANHGDACCGDPDACSAALAATPEDA